MNLYKIYIFDRQINEQYPITVEKQTINDLCRLLNNHVLRFDVEVVSAYVLDKNGGIIDEVDFLPFELTNQMFITTYKSRLVAHNNFINGV